MSDTVAAMHPTVKGSAQQGLQTVAGLSLGILVASLALLAGPPSSFTVAFVVGAGALLAATLPHIGGGGVLIPSAWLFVLVLGGSDTAFSIGYFAQTILSASSSGSPSTRSCYRR